MPGRGIGELEHGTAPTSPRSPAVAERGTTAAPKPSPTNRTTASEVASSNATRRAHPGPGERGVDLLPQPGLGPHLDERPRAPASSARSAGRVRSGWSPGTTATSGSSARTRWARSAGHLVGEQPDERQIQVARAHLLGHLPAAGVADGDLDAGVALVERGQRALHHRRGLPGAADHAEPQPPGDHARRTRPARRAAVSTSASTARARGSSTSPAGASAHRAAGALEQRDARAPVPAGRSGSSAPTARRGTAPRPG